MVCLYQIFSTILFTFLHLIAVAFVVVDCVIILGGFFQSFSLNVGEKNAKHKKKKTYENLFKKKNISKMFVLITAKTIWYDVSKLLQLKECS